MLLQQLWRGRRFTKRYLFTSYYLWASTSTCSSSNSNYSYYCQAMSTTSTNSKNINNKMSMSGTTTIASSDDNNGGDGGVRVSIAQLCSTGNKFQNLLNVAKCAGYAKRNGSKMLFLPECFGFIGESSQQTLKEAEPPIHIEETKMMEPKTNDKLISDALRITISKAAGAADERNNDKDKDNLLPNSEIPYENISLLDGLKTIAQESDLWLSAGGMHEGGAPPRDEDDDKQNDNNSKSNSTGSSSSSEQQASLSRVYNSHVIMDNNGVVQCVYRKMHLFDVTIPEDNVYLRESATTAPGTKLVTCVNTPIGCLGVSTCYDVRFPEMYIQLVREGGAQVLLVPSAFTVPTGKAHWHTLLRARAIENQCYVIAAAQYGKHNHKRESYGHSLAVDPWGRILADAGGSDGPGTSGSSGKDNVDVVTTPSIVSCNIDLTVLESIQKRMPIQQHRDSCHFSF